MLLPKGLTKRGRPRKTLEWTPERLRYLIDHHDESDSKLAEHFGVCRQDIWHARMKHGIGKELCNIAEHTG